MHLRWKRIFAVVIPAAVLMAALYRSDVRAESDTFPVYECLQPNVAFWTKIYTEYSSDRGVIHDKRKLNRIYGVIELVDPDRPGGRKINKQRIKKTKKMYKTILGKLMRGKAPVGAVEQHVAGLLGPETKPEDFRLAMRNIRCQTGQRDRFRAGLIRSGAYIDEIRQIFRNDGLPEDLVYLPHVESSFNPKAYSKFGAAGIWQFTRSTGRHFMKVGYTIDQRRDPIVSSRAAAKLLRQNYQKFKNWPMAITAYNHGTTGMLRARRSRGSYEAIFKNYRSRIFRFASRNFYSEFLAAREAAGNYRQYFGDLKLDIPVRSREIVLAGYVSLPKVAQHLKLDLTDLRKFNPALRHPVFRGQKYVPAGYRLRLPDRSDEDWESLIAQLPDKLYRHYQKRSHIYTVRRGDTAGKIAGYHGVKLNDLIAANNLDARATIYVNQNIRIPLPDKKAVRIAKHEPQKPETKKNTVAVRIRTAGKDAGLKWSRATSLPPANRSEQSTDHIDQIMRIAKVKKKTVWVAESKYRRPVEEKPEPQLPIVAADITSNYVTEKTAGEPIQIQPAGKIAEQETSSTPGAHKMEIKKDTKSQPLKFLKDKQVPESKRTMDLRRPQHAALKPQMNPEIIQGHFNVKRVWTQRGKPVGAIRVEVEETLGHYAEWLGVPARKLRQLNGFEYGRTLHLNQKIKIPLHRVAKEEFEEKRFEYHQELAENFFSSYRIDKILTYSIKRGDNIWTLSRREFEVPLWLIKRYNANVDFNALIPSQKLLIPVVEKNV